MKSILLVLVLLLTACTGGLKPTEGTAGTVAKIAVTYGVMKYCEKAGSPAAQVARCTRVKTFATEAKALAAGDAVSITALEAELISKLPMGLSASDRILAIALIQAIEQELLNRIGTGLLKPEQLLVVQQVLDWVIQSTVYVTG